MYYPKGATLKRNNTTVIATDEINEFGDTTFLKDNSNIRCVFMGGNFYHERGAAAVRRRLAKNAAPIVLSALKQALQHAREAMPADERVQFDDRKSGPEWMFSARDAIALTK